MSEVAEFREEPNNMELEEIHEKIKAQKEDSQIFSSTPLTSVNCYSPLFCSRRAEGTQWNLKGQKEKSLELIKQIFLWNI